MRAPAVLPRLAVLAACAAAATALAATASAAPRAAAAQAAPARAAHTITAKAALTKAGQIARSRGLATGASEYYAFGCERRSVHVIDCIGAIVFPDGSGCAQVVRTSAASHTAKSLTGKLIGSPLCGEPEQDFPAPSDSGGSSGETAICAIRSSVCISGN